MNRRELLAGTTALITANALRPAHAWPFHGTPANNFNGHKWQLNFDFLGTGNTEFPFLNAMKTCSGIAFSNVNTVNRITPSDLDAQGYMTDFNTYGQQLVYQIPTLPLAVRNGDYIIIGRGIGTVNITGAAATAVSDVPASIYYEAPTAQFPYDHWKLPQTCNSDTMLFYISASNSTPNHIRSIVVVHADDAIYDDYTALAVRGEIFQKKFLDHVSNFGALRFLNWTYFNPEYAALGTKIGDFCDPDYYHWVGWINANEWNPNIAARDIVNISKFTLAQTGFTLTQGCHVWCRFDHGNLDTGSVTNIVATTFSGSPATKVYMTTMPAGWAANQQMYFTVQPVSTLPEEMTWQHYNCLDASTTAVTPVSISTLTAAANIATCTTSGAHSLVSGTMITVSGATPSAYNGTFNITVTGTTTFTYTMASSPGSSASPVGSYTGNAYTITVNYDVTTAVSQFNTHGQTLWTVSSLPTLNVNGTGDVLMANGQGAANWVSGGSYTVGDMVVDTTGGTLGQFYQCVNAGSAGSTAPHSDGSHTYWNPVSSGGVIQLTYDAGYLNGAGGWFPQFDYISTKLNLDFTEMKIAPISIITALCNKVGARPWINIPHVSCDAPYATPTYSQLPSFVSDVATYFKNNLKSGIKPIFEPGNEVWDVGSSNGAAVYAWKRNMWRTQTFIPGFTKWNNSTNYSVGQYIAYTWSSGKTLLSRCLTASGPGTGAGARDPETYNNHTYWIWVAQATLPADADNWYGMASSLVGQAVSNVYGVAQADVRTSNNKSYGVFNGWAQTMSTFNQPRIASDLFVCMTSNSNNAGDIWCTNMGPAIYLHNAYLGTTAETAAGSGYANWITAGQPFPTSTSYFDTYALGMNPPAWISGGTYVVGDPVWDSTGTDANGYHNSYVCKTNVSGSATSPASDPTHWQQTGTLDGNAGTSVLGPLLVLLENIIPICASYSGMKFSHYEGGMEAATWPPNLSPPTGIDNYRGYSRISSNVGAAYTAMMTGTNGILAQCSAAGVTSEFPSQYLYSSGVEWGLWIYNPYDDTYGSTGYAAILAYG